MHSQSTKPLHVCQACGKSFQPNNPKRAKFCSRDCRATGDRMAADARVTERFWSHVDKTETCWLWRGAVRPNGYGHITHHGQSIAVHRLSWELTNGAVPDGLLVCHHCDVRNCVRPDHLFVGTQVDNLRDMRVKGRQNYLGPKDGNRAEHNPKAKLTWEHVRAIRRDYATGQYTYRSLAPHYDISWQSVCGIITQRTWRE